MHMPGMTGLEVCKQVRSGNHREIWIIFLTVRDEGKSEEVRGLEAGGRLLLPNHSAL